VVVYNSCIHKANAVAQWLASHPRIAKLWLPTYGPQANPLERVCGDVHDQWTRNHQRKRFGDVVHDVERHLRQNSP
jgi:transposase